MTSRQEPITYPYDLSGEWTNRSYLGLSLWRRASRAREQFGRRPAGGRVIPPHIQLVDEREAEELFGGSFDGYTARIGQTRDPILLKLGSLIRTGQLTRERFIALKKRRCGERKIPIRKTWFLLEFGMRWIFEWIPILFFATWDKPYFKPDRLSAVLTGGSPESP